jgi:hypothetical protein
MKNSIWPVLLVIVVAAVGGIAWYLHTQQAAPQTPPPIAALPSSTPPPAPATHYPLEGTQAPPAKPLPSLDGSDEEARHSIIELFGQGAIELFQLKDLIRRIVVTVDNLPRERVSNRLMALKPVPGRLVVSNASGAPSISPENYSRYSAYVHLAQAVDIDKLVAVYVRLYPLFQQAYVQLGYPDGYFNDRLVAMIDNLLATPKLGGPPQLVQPSVMYQYADPDLESLSAGQKMLLRMGPDNAAVVEAKLRELRTAVTRSSVAH